MVYIARFCLKTLFKEMHYILKKIKTHITDKVTFKFLIEHSSSYGIKPMSVHLHLISNLNELDSGSLGSLD